MRFVTRSLMGLMLLTLTVALLALAGNSLVTALKDRSSGGFGNRQARERVFTVEVADLTLGRHAPEIKTFGEVISGRTLELRAAASGALVQISDSFREGGVVKKGEILFQSDPANARSKLLISQNELAETEADLLDAKRNLSLAEDEVKAATDQRDLRRKAMERQNSLSDRGLGTDTAMETSELAVSAAEQALLAKRLSLANAQAAIARAETLLGRRQINRDEAARVLAETTVVADFDGVLTGVSAVLGRLVNANEQLGSLIDPTALEVSFRVSSGEFRALAAADNGLQQAEVQIDVASGTRFSGQIDRVSAAVGEGMTGRELFAKVQDAAGLGIQPGDFVTVTLREPPLDNVANIPATAATTNGAVLLIGADNRLEEATVEILRKQGDNLIVRADHLAGRQIVLARAPQLGTGIRVEPRSSGDVIAEQSAPPPPQNDTIEITEDQRQRLIDFIQKNDRIPAERKLAMVQSLRQTRVPKTMVDRITQRMGG
ncbi:HlyD family efflux transporter periplasmic adaptor subunit [Roseobacter sp. N2S]|uniref:efflux RND transporter periplasmic adaptor subunit n=1 Tax=Roseobacter sp. N2S TaxID=2663844 RepID=UPI002864D14D|nr:HlyD family efflux transporter periplasmic adaptor subunit [Roseobacter sp. N2S]MDR6263858.1 multidrug resistance efflux pump [Roseobacter sp. N2S]